MKNIALTPRSYFPEIRVNSAGQVRALSIPGDAGDIFAKSLELAAIAIDDLARPVFSRVPLLWQTRLFHRLRRMLKKTGNGGEFDMLRFRSAAATVLLNMAEGARRGSAARRLRRDVVEAYLDLFARAESPHLRESMMLNLQRAKDVLDRKGRERLGEWFRALVPQAPPYEAWFSGNSETLRIVCQVQDVYYRPWLKFLLKEGFRKVRHRDLPAVVLEKTVTANGRRTVFQIRYLEKAEGIFTPMKDPETDVVMFLGHSDWWARVPRNIRNAPDQKGAKLLVLILCFGKDFYHLLHNRYPDAHIITSKDPTDDPEDLVLIRHLFDGIALRRSWKRIERDVNGDPGNPDRNFIFPGDAVYKAGYIDEDRDGRVDFFDRFCNVSRIETVEPANIEESFIPDPIRIHPRGVALRPRQVDGSKVFEASLILNSLSYDNYFLDLVNRDQRVVGGGWHLPGFGEFSATRFTPIVRDRKPLVRLSVSIRHAHAAQSAVTAMVAYEGYRYFSRLLRPVQAPLDSALMGVILVTQAIINCNYPAHEKVFYAFLRRYGFPRIDIKRVEEVIEADSDWESGSPASLRRLKRSLSRDILTLIEEISRGVSPS